MILHVEAMFASDPRNLGHLVHHYGGKDVGSFIEPSISPLRESVTRAMFVDATHDNDPGHIQVYMCVHSVVTCGTHTCGHFWLHSQGVFGMHCLTLLWLLWQDVLLAVVADMMSLYLTW